jgi:hypothetical protein
MAAYYDLVMGLESALGAASRFGPFGGAPAGADAARPRARGDTDDFRSASASMAE